MKPFQRIVALAYLNDPERIPKGLCRVLPHIEQQVADINKERDEQMVRVVQKYISNQTIGQLSTRLMSTLNVSNTNTALSNVTVNASITYVQLAKLFRLATPPRCWQRVSSWRRRRWVSLRASQQSSFWVLNKSRKCLLNPIIPYRPLHQAPHHLLLSMSQTLDSVYSAKIRST